MKKRHTKTKIKFYEEPKTIVRLGPLAVVKGVDAPDVRFKMCSGATLRDSVVHSVEIYPGSVCNTIDTNLLFQREVAATTKTRRSRKHQSKRRK